MKGQADALLLERRMQKQSPREEEEEEVRAVASGAPAADVWLLLAFVGTRYCGWQSQSRGAGAAGAPRAVEDALAAAAAAAAGAPAAPFTAASRTDAGVHAHEVLLRTTLSAGAAAVVAAAAAAAAVAAAAEEEGADAGAEALRGRLNAALPPDVRVRRLRLCLPSQIHLRRLSVRKQYSYYVRTGSFAAADALAQRGTQFEKGALDVSLLARALAPCADGAPHCYAPFAAAKRARSGAGGAAKSDAESVRRVDVVAVSLLRLSECRFAIDDERGCAADDAGLPVDIEGGCSGSGGGGGGLVLPATSGGAPARRKRPRKENVAAGEEEEEEEEKEKVGVSADAAAADAASDAAAEDPRCIVRIRFVGSGFLRHMLRRLVGAALAVARGKLPVTYIRDVLVAADARLAAPSGGAAPEAAADGAARDYAVAHGRGLWLERTLLPPGFFERERFTTNTLASFRAQHGFTDADLFVDAGAGPGPAEAEAGEGEDGCE